MRIAFSLILLAMASPLKAEDPAYAKIPATFEEVERRFTTLPMEARRLIGPLLWLHGDESRKQLETEIAKIAEGGNGCFTAESRPHSEWLDDKWYRDLAICLKAAKKHDLKMWIFDERWWPSQTVAGKVPEKYAAKRLAAETQDVEGPLRHQAGGFSGGDHVAAVAGKLTDDGSVDASTLIDLAPSIRNGRLSVNLPAGKWRIFRFHHVLAPRLGQGNQLSVDGASKDCVDWFIRTVYQPHYDRFKEDFGNTIVGFFYDEPETVGDWGTELPGHLEKRGADWKKAYVAHLDQLAGEEQVVARHAYLSALAETWGETMYGGLSKWCEARGVVSIGHFMEHRLLYLNRNYCAGDMMLLQKYNSMGGIDAVFNQFDWNNRVGRDAPAWQNPKLGSSVSHAYGRPNDISMVEIFGARGQDLSYPEMKWWTDHMFASGINFLVPHSFNPRGPFDNDCPPYFYNSGHEPRWPLYRVFADYSARLSNLLTGGRHVAPVALVPPGLGYHAGRPGQALPADQISEALQDALYDCDWLPCEVIENDVQVEGRELQLRDERYRILILPAAEALPYPVLEKAARFHAAGGTVVGYGILPAVSTTFGRTEEDVAALRDAIWGADPKPAATVCRISPDGGRSYFLPDKPAPDLLRQVFADAGILPTLEVLEGDTGNNLHVLHRVRNDRDIFFVANQNHTGEARDYTFRIHAKGFPEVWDAMRNHIGSIPFERNGDTVDLSLTLQPNDSAVLVFQLEKRELPPRDAPSAGEARIIPVARRLVPSEDLPVPKADGRPLTISQVKGDRFQGACEIPAGIDLRQTRIHLECGGIAPEQAAHVMVNGAYVGGFLSKPFRLEISSHLKNGANIIDIRPFAPEEVTLVIEPLPEK